MPHRCRHFRGMVRDQIPGDGREQASGVELIEGEGMLFPSPTLAAAVPDLEPAH
jgi:hypothetical protein